MARLFPLGTSEHVSKRHVLVLAGPCGAGKSTVARLLTQQNESCIWVKEIEPPQSVRDSDCVTTEAAELFQEAIITSRQRMLLEDNASRIIIVDRTFEEDREIFYPLYEKLGFLRSEQVAKLTRMSLAAEALAGPAKCGIVLNTQREVLRQRILNSRRPTWLIDSFNLQYELYADWIKRIRDRFIVLDVAELDPETIVRFITGKLFASQYL